MKSRVQKSAAALAAIIAASAAPVRAAEADAADLSLEDLLKTEVVTVSRKSQTLQSTAAAAFVITHEDIERSGATTLPEVLRMAPGVEVARIANNRWAVTVRGFNGRFANKLLVLVDGRSVYSPLFSGVLWEAEDTLLEDIDHIEVIRGPGAALWGANAVNGVINIITRKARDTQGNLVVAGAGSVERGFAALRHGDAADDGHYRVWAKAFDRGASSDFSGVAGNDTWRGGRAGFRRDWALGASDRFSLSGEAYDGPSGDRWNIADVASATGYTPTNVVQRSEGAHLLGRREWRLADDSEAALQAYVDYSDFDIHAEIVQKRATFDIDFQRRMLLGERHDFIWGVGYRLSRDEIVAEGIFGFTPRNRALSLASAFAQDEFTLVPDRLRLIAGLRLEHNNFTGLEPQPNLRLSWTPTPNQSVWGAVSHAVRTPSRAEQDAQVDLFVTPANPPFVPLPVLTRNVALPGSLQKSERVDTLEAGYRQQVESNLSLDVSAFFSRYRGLRSGALGDTSMVLDAPVPYILQEIHPNNGMQAHTHGIEVALDWHPAAWWRLQPSYSYLRVAGSSMVPDPVTINDAAGIGASAPRHQVSVRSAFSPGGHQQWDLWLRHVDKLSVIDAQGHPIPAYTTLDLRWAWRPQPALELSLVGQNLLARRHAEFVPDLLPSQTLQVPRSGYLKAKFQF